MDTKTALAIVLEDYDDDEYFFIEDMVDYGHVKHDRTAYYCIVQRQSDKTFWKISYVSSYENGIDEDSAEACEVERKEIKKYKWVKK